MTVRQLIDAIDSGKTLDIEAAFEGIMADKVATKLDAFRQEVAKNMFASQVDEAKEKDDEEKDEKEDEDEDEEKEDMKEGAFSNPGLEALAAKKRAEREAAAKAKTK
jgi:Ran GTPase-activating protein (RanGAP) involved in mRNA processing and transport